MVKKSPADAGEAGLIPRGGKDSSLQYSCLGNPVDRGA